MQPTRGISIDFGNVAGACRDSNRSKGAKDPGEFTGQK